MDGINFKKPVKLSDLMQGTSFEFSSVPTANDHEFEDDMFWNEDQQIDDYKNPCETSFDDWRSSMHQLSEGVYKKVQKPAAADAKQINLNCQRVSYHRNFFLENEEHPFDSTYLNDRIDLICLPMEKKKVYLDGVLEALESMKEGEKSLFLIGYKKMFKASGCAPRVPQKAEILCELEIVKVEDVGDQDKIDKLDDNGMDKFSEVKDSIEEIFVRASDYFCREKLEAALKGYCRILQVATFAKTEDAKEQELRTEVLRRAHLNIAVVNNKRGDHKEALNQIQGLEALESIEQNSKALYQKGLALMRLGEYEKAAVPIAKALRLKPLNREIIKAVEELDNRKKAYEDNKKEFAKKLGFQ